MDNNIKPFRGQFFYGHNPDRFPENFEVLDFGQNGFLYYHPELPVARIQVGEWSSVLVGQVFDPVVPANDIDGILNDIMQDPTSIIGIVNRTNRLAGRWAMLVKSPEQEIVFHDACGTMPIVVFSRDGAVSIASSTKLLSFCVDGLVINTEIESHRPPDGKFHSGFIYPLQYTEYIDVKVLVPNHYLDLKQGSIHRYHPVSKLPQISVKVAALQVSEMFKNIILSVSQRYTIAVGVSSGYDSRVIVGAVGSFPDIVKKTLFFSMIDNFGCPPGHADTVLGGKVCKAVGGDHAEFSSPLVNEYVQKACRESENMKAPRFEAWAETSMGEQFKNRIVLTGWGGEEGKAALRWDGSDQVTVEQIMGLSDFRKISHLLPEYEQWFRESTDIRDRYDMNILDLYHWEQRTGIRTGRKLNILNLGCDWVAIYSCRDLLNIMQSVPEADRGAPGHILHAEIIRQLDPRLLEIPANPYSFFIFKKDAKNSIKKIVKSIARIFGIDGYLTRIYRNYLK